MSSELLTCNEVAKVIPQGHQYSIVIDIICMHINYNNNMCIHCQLLVHGQ